MMPLQCQHCCMSLSTDYTQVSFLKCSLGVGRGVGELVCGERICEKHPKNKQTWVGGEGDFLLQKKRTVYTQSSRLQKLWGVSLMHLSATITTCG